MRCLKDYISPVLCGGLGNNLFQVATSLSYSKDSSVESIFGYWSSHNSMSRLPEDHNSKSAGLPNPFFNKWAGWKTRTDFNLKDIFPRLNWFENQDPAAPGEFSTLNEIYHWSFGIDTGTGGIYEPLNIKQGDQFYGYFFNKKYWHHNRETLLYNLSFDPDRVNLVKSKYGELLDKKSVSINLRFSDLDVASESEMSYRLGYIDQIEFIVNAISMFGKDSRFIVTSSDQQKSKDLINSDPRLEEYDFVFINEDFDLQLIISSMCTGHILTNSTFSFWCCYLDPNVEWARVIVSKTFEEAHSKEMIPYNWKII